MFLRNTSENFVVPPIGRYKAKITAAEGTVTGNSSKTPGAPMIKITGEIREPIEYASAQFYDNFLTDERISARGAGIAKKKLRGLGVNVDSEVEVSDQQIVAHLLGLECWVDLDHEQIKDKNPATEEYDQPRFNMENGQRVPAMKLVAKGYYSSNVGVQTAPQGQQHAPQGFPQPPQGFAPVPQAPQGFAPQGYAPGAPAGYAAPQMPQAPQGFAPGAPAGWTPPGQVAAPQGIPQGIPQGYAPGFAPGAPAPGYAPGFAPPVNGSPAAAPLPWAQPPQGAPQAEANAGGGRGRKAKS
jgi:hypothetical protein